MKKGIIAFVLLLTVAVNAQKYQRIGYIDMEYILQNVPEYITAQNTLNSKIEKWKTKLDKEARHIEVLKTDLANEKAILTKDLIEEREEDIKIKQELLRTLEARYFGSNGDMYSLRKQLVQPVQDQVYNAVQDIATKKKYDFIFDKSNDLVMLYSNKKHDISELVLRSIRKIRKIKDRKEKVEEKRKAKAREKANPTNLSDTQKEKLAQKKLNNAKREADRVSKQKALEEKRAKRLQQREEKRRILREKKEALRKAREEKLKKQKANNKNNN